MVPITFGQETDDQGERRRPYKLPPNLLNHFQGRYGAVDDFLISTLQETADGPLGHINIRGHIVPAGEIQGVTREERARATAIAFIKEERELLDIGNPAELRETSMRIDEQGGSAIAYGWYLGDLPLLDSRIQIHTGPDGAISRVHATLKPVPPELYEAIGKRTLKENEIIKIVQRNLVLPGRENEVKLISEPGKFASWRSPYVVWAALASVEDKPAWSYTIDAFTGEILRKSCTAVTIRHDPISTPCD
jgi:Zn-dependent metalloprotease